MIEHSEETLRKRDAQANQPPRPRADYVEAEIRTIEVQFEDRDFHAELLPTDELDYRETAMKITQYVVRDGKSDGVRVVTLDLTKANAVDIWTHKVLVPKTLYTPPEAI